MKFDAKGNFAWLQEAAGAALAGIVSTDAEVTIAGEWGTLATPIVVRQYDAQSGNLIWDRQAGGVRTLTSGPGINTTQRLVVDAQGNIMILASDQGDYVVIRFDPDGDPMPTWRATIDPDNDTMTTDDDVSATGIVALPDGGAIVTGFGQAIGGGYVTVRLDAQGNNVFTDVELGDLGNPLGPTYLANSTDGSVVIGGSPESFGGVPQAQIWSISPGGNRKWHHVISHPGMTIPSTFMGLALESDGDVIIGVAGLSDPFRVLYLVAQTGEVVWDVGVPFIGYSTLLAVAPNGRVLVGGLNSSQQSSHIAEFDSAGHPCRVANNFGTLGAFATNPGSADWITLGTRPTFPVAGGEAFVSRFDGGGACTETADIFTNGFY